MHFSSENTVEWKARWSQWKQN